MKLPEKGLGSMLVFSFVLFLFVGFMFPSSSKSSQPVRDLSKHEETETNIEEIDFASGNIADHITQYYGHTQFAAVHGGLKGNRHNGIDIASEFGSNIKSESDGEVFYVGDQDKYCPNKAYGKFVIIKNDDGKFSLLYAHFNTIKVRKGEKVKEGDLLGTVGTTGLATGPHLHFTVFKTSTFEMTDDSLCGPKPTGTDIDPLNYLD